MKKFIALTVIALALTGCAAKEEVVEPVVVEETAPAAEVPADAQVVSGEVSSWISSEGPVPRLVTRKAGLEPLAT